MVFKVCYGLTVIPVHSEPQQGGAPGTDLCQFACALPPHKPRRLRGKHRRCPGVHDLLIARPQLCGKGGGEVGVAGRLLV